MNNLKVVNRSILSQKPDSTIIDIMQSHGSTLGNPFYRDKISRKERISKFRIWLWNKVKARDPRVMAELLKIKELVLSGNTVYLMCCCKPAPCHGDVIKDCVEWSIAKGVNYAK